ncbi:MAG: hypothetical protein F6J86_18525 [Symploca sp. SIO1B1]|nr:hypothetical protein [Symploca sp. SIO1B1]
MLSFLREPALYQWLESPLLSSPIATDPEAGGYFSSPREGTPVTASTGNHLQDGTADK